MRFKNTFALLGLILIITVMTCPASIAGEIDEGTLITKENLDSNLNNTFDGHKLSDLLTDIQEMLIREQGLRMRLQHSEPWPVDERWIEANKKYGGSAKFNPETGLVEGYVAGECFPNVSIDDPHAGMKLLWNSQKTGGYPRGDDQWIPSYSFVFIDGDKGVTRTQKWAMIRISYQGRLSGEPVIDPDIYTATTLFAWEPYDIAGLGSFIYRYHDGRMDDTWAYLRSVRRVRRCSGGGWFDPIGGTDLLQDDKEVLDVNPTWYEGVKVLGKRHILHVCRSSYPGNDPKMPCPWQKEDDTFPGLDLAHPPYFNPNPDLNPFMPREVWVLEVITPDAHPYGKKILYMDTQIPLMLEAEAYDKKGDFWRWVNFCLTPIRTNDGGWGVLSNICFATDYQRNASTVAIHPNTTQWNVGLDPQDLNVRILEQAAGGAWRKMAKHTVEFPNPKYVPNPKYK